MCIFFIFLYIHIYIHTCVGFFLVFFSFHPVCPVKFRQIINVFCGYSLVMLTQVVFTHSNNSTQVAALSCLLFA